MVPRVLHVAQPVEGGVAVAVEQVAADQRARGWQVAVACPGTGSLPVALLRRGVPHLVWPARRAPGLRTVAEIRSLRRIVDLARPDVLHLHSSKASLAGRLAVRGAVPTLVSPHGWSWLAGGPVLATAARAWERHGARWTDLCVCVGPGEAGLAVEAAIPGALAVVRNGVDLTRYRPAGPAARRAARAALALGPDDPVAVCVGRVCRQKGQDVAVRAWPAVRAAVPGARLVLVGERHDTVGPAEAGIAAVGEVGDVRTWLAAADVVVLPSRWEGLSLALLEALATGRPVVASRVPGLADAVGEGTGALVPPEDEAALASAVVARLHDPRRRVAEGAAAAAHARDFDLRHALDHLAAVTAAAASSGARSTDLRRTTGVDDRGPSAVRAAGW
ncbi:glycosyltransferase [Actinomycetospora sp. TBRC 11914]|uniref:glycosyltransferase n=1 Tax=Actinomycetospora sp. TBRC 11914 TaxID=2729387 RepID=UPI00145FA466|nr:glycosyltransferase [Actinomycetospora sp. TBRC 11914]NMO92389.1 glycosyltransferase family 4 protein [Actinomycetospora sp. TBRC 11914]